MVTREKSEAELYCEIKEAFQVFDRDNDGIITKDEETTILRMFGINPNEKDDKTSKKDDKKGKEGEQNEDEENGDENDEAKQAEEEQEKEQKIETVEFNEFFDNIQQKLKDALKDNEILEEIDNGTIMNVRELEHELQGCKEHISNELIRKIIKDSTPNGGNYVVYEDFVKLMLNKS
jgi:Ca2+-binding EF-hand superfamily protein